jgi:hypothetical protein
VSWGRIFILVARSEVETLVLDTRDLAIQDFENIASDDDHLR